MKRLIAMVLCVLLACSAGLALASATHTETGEVVTYDDGSLRVYDRVVFEVVDVNTQFRNIVISEAPTPAVVAAAVGQSLAEALATGELETAEIANVDKLVGTENAAKIESLPVADKLEAIMYMMGMIGDADLSEALLGLGLEQVSLFDPATGEFMSDVELLDFTSDDLSKGSAESGFGYLLVDGERVPFMRMAFEVVHADSGVYAGLSLSQRTYIENYNFVFDAEDGSWSLFSIITGAKEFFGQ